MERAPAPTLPLKGGGQRLQNCLDCLIELLIDEFHRETNDAIAGCSKPIVAPGIVDQAFAVMGRAIDLDDEPRLMASEVGEVGSDGCLPTELESTELPHTKPRPHKSLDCRHVPAKGLGAFSPFPQCAVESGEARVGEEREGC